MSSVALRFVPVVAVLGLVPGLLFALDRPGELIGLSTASVLLITSCLYWMVSAETASAGIGE
jgi:uncharacterized RDD family membrane protein YckC